MMRLLLWPLFAAAVAASPPPGDAPAIRAALRAASVGAGGAPPQTPPGRRAPAHRCVHDHIANFHATTGALHSNGSRAFQDYGGGRRLQVGPAASWAPLRIAAEFADLSDPSMTPALEAWVRGTLVPRALARWGELLRVRPVQGALSVGAPTSCPLGPSDAPLTLSPASSWPGADTVVFITTKQTASCGSAGSGVLAYASSCARDQLDRPIAGRINLCPGSLDADPGALAFQLGVVVHELGHALGFTGADWPLFRRADGSPRTPRDPANPWDVAPGYKATFACGGATATRAVASPETIAYFDERGLGCTWPNVGGRTCVGKFVTPAAVAAARAFTGCAAANGVEIEGEDTTPCAPQASHLEQTRWNTGLMCPYAQHRLYVTPIELAVFEDSGWYAPNYAAADETRPGLSWAAGAGCAVALDKCIRPDGTPSSPRHFFTATRGTAEGNAVCTLDRRAVGFADVSEAANPPPPFAYWPAQPGRGGTLPAVFDFCPAVQAYSNLICEDPADAFSYAASLGSAFGPGSVCLESSLAQSGSGARGMGAGCYKVACTSQTSLTITVGASAVTCDAGSAGQARSVPGFSGAVTCPNPADMCGPYTGYGGTAAAPAPPSASSASSSSPSGGPTPRSSATQPPPPPTTSAAPSQPPPPPGDVPTLTPAPAPAPGGGGDGGGSQPWDTPFGPTPSPAAVGGDGGDGGTSGGGDSVPALPVMPSPLPWDPAQGAGDGGALPPPSPAASPSPAAPGSAPWVPPEAPSGPPQQPPYGPGGRWGEPGGPGAPPGRGGGPPPPGGFRPSPSPTAFAPGWVPAAPPQQPWAGASSPLDSHRNNNNTANDTTSDDRTDDDSEEQGGEWRDDDDDRPHSPPNASAVGGASSGAAGRIPAASALVAAVSCVLLALLA